MFGIPLEDLYAFGFFIVAWTAYVFFAERKAIRVASLLGEMRHLSGTLDAANDSSR